MTQDLNREEFDIVVSAGQSNSGGYGWGPTAEPYVPTDDVWFLNPDFSLTVAAENETGELEPVFAKHTDVKKCGNFSLSFARIYMEEGMLRPGRKLLLVRAAIGGTEWAEGQSSYALLVQMIEAALKMNPKNKLAAFLWHQGESSVFEKHTYEQHYGLVMKIANTVRGTFNAPALPFLVGQFVYEWEKYYAPEGVEPVARARRDAAADIPYGGYVESYGLQSNAEAFGDLQGDHIHFCRDALYKFGYRYFDVFKQILSGTD